MTAADALRVRGERPHVEVGVDCRGVVCTVRVVTKDGWSGVSLCHESDGIGLTCSRLCTHEYTPTCTKK
jgi:hypothetical protein